jgi:ABC-type multidrug transport system fused ATPase/permease subunit
LDFDQKLHCKYFQIAPFAGLFMGDNISVLTGLRTRIELEGEAKAQEAVNYFVYAYLILGAVALVSGLLQSVLAGVAGYNLAADLEQKVFGHVLDLDVEFFDQNEAGVLATQMASDATTVRKLFQGPLQSWIIVFVTTIGGLSVSLAFKWDITLVMIGGVSLVVGVAFWERWQMEK